MNRRTPSIPLETSPHDLEHQLTTLRAALDESEARFRTIVCNAQAVIFVLDERGVFVLSEGLGLASLGLKPGQVVGLSAFDVYRDYPDVVDGIRRSLAGELTRATVEVQGAVFDVLYSPRLDATGRRSGVIGLATDITERRHAERELARQADELRALNNLTRRVSASLSLDVTVAAGIDGLLEATSADAAFLFLREGERLVLRGLGPASAAAPFAQMPEHRVGLCLCGLAISQEQAVYSEDICSDPRCALEECRQAGYRSFAALPLRRSDGLLGVIGLASRAPRDFKARAEFLETLAATVSTALVNARLFGSLRESEARLSESQRMARVGHLEYNAAEGLWRVSPFVQELFGLPPGSVLDLEGWERLIHPDDLDEAKRYLFDVLAKGAPFNHEYRIRRLTDGVVRWVSGLSNPELDEHGQAVRWFGTVQDVTDRKEAEEERRKLQAELLQAQKMESVGRLAGGVAHDFNNMLLAIIGNATLAQEQLQEGGDVGEFLDEIRTAAERSAQLTRQLLAFARKQTVRPRVLDVNEEISGTLKMLHRLLGEQIRLNWRPGTEVWRVEMDPAQIDQIIANLTVNARDAIDGSGTITIETSNVTLDDWKASEFDGGQAGDYVMLAVSDTGRGIDPHTREHLFEPFFTTKEVGRSTGLGLATVFGIVKQNRGAIEVLSVPGQGSTFRVYLPRAGSAPSAAVVFSAPDTARGTETILLAEDEDQVLTLGRRILERCGYTVLAARGPEEAIEIAERYKAPIHLLLSDVVMPGMNGRDLRDRLAVWQPGMRCIFMSGYTADVIAPHGVLEPGVEFLQKPFSAATLSQKEREVLDR